MNYTITSAFGSIDPAHPLPHKGVDLAMPTGTPVSSIGNGIVSAVTDEGTRSFGKAIKIHLENGTDVIYGHLSEIDVLPGQRIHTGQLVGLSGSTGDSTGPHLHIQVMDHGTPIDPMPIINPGVAQFGAGHAAAGGTPPNIGGMFQQAFENWFSMFGHGLLKLAPDMLLVVCMASILGTMIGSERCRRWASVSAIGAMIAKAVSNIV